MARKLTPITPGEILLTEFLKPLGISQSRFVIIVSLSSITSSSAWQDVQS